MVSPRSEPNKDLPLTPPTSVRKKQNNNNANISPKLLLKDLLQNDRLSPVSSPEKKLIRRQRTIRRPKPNSVLSIENYPQIKPSQNQSNDYLKVILTNSQEIVVVAGAGISTHAGIPDFRSKQNGLYTKSQKNKSLMDLNMIYSDESTTLQFNDLMVSLHDKSINAELTPFHKCLDKLANEKRLKRIYTQNIDSLEKKLENVSINNGKFPTLVQLHGSIDNTKCNKCNNIKPFDPTRFKNSNNNTGSLIPSCLECEEMESVRAIAGLRSKGVGIIRPTITLYNEVHTEGDSIANIINYDTKLKSIDLLIIVGTMLSIPHVRKLCQNMAYSMKHGRRKKGHVIFVCNEPPTQSILNGFDNNIDLIVLGDCQSLYDYV
ncbi:hypothetical protein C6P45_000299 [Maudiozyma exigua]|uniref:Deacetylase sirtuin-type domain-containing protein n=1 Tax=Maudiozyma exigua TaxID=34358 RepID=A0A9P6W757_MAUEX|nr:hypothetical protein C6P45_000299 [Kazachstania exigua]